MNGVDAEGRYEDVAVSGYAVYAHRHNEDHAYTELSDVVPSLDLAKTLAEQIIRAASRGNERADAPKNTSVEILGPRLDESFELEDVGGELVWVPDP